MPAKTTNKNKKAKATESPSPKKAKKNLFDAHRGRAETLGGFLRLADHVMTGKSGVQSLFLSCSQYYCDEAGDAVHDSVTTSTKLVPDANDGGDRIAYGTRGKYMRWDDNGDSVYHFSPFCEEGGEGMEDGEGSSPLLLAQRAGDGGVRATWLGELHRPWLDFHGALKRDSDDISFMDDYDDDDDDDADDDGDDDRGLQFAKDPSPATLESAQEKELYAQVLATPNDLGVREVLADVWNQREDPRGEHAALTSSTNTKSKKRSPEMVRRATALVLEHGRSWLGPLASVIPLSGALFDRGPFVRAATIYAASAKTLAKLANAPEWATMEELSFANQSARLLTPAMKSLRVVGPLKAKDLEPLRAKGTTWRIEDLEFEGTQLAPLHDLKLPLRCLKLRTSAKVLAADLKSLAKEAGYWSRLERLELWLPEGREGASAEDDGAAVEKTFKAAAAFIAPTSTCRLAVGVLSSGRRSGWMLTGAGNAKERRLELALPDGRFEQGAAWAKAFGVKLTSWEPTASASDWVHFALGVSDETGKRKAKRK